MRPGQTLRLIKHRFRHVLFHDPQRGNVTFVSLINHQMRCCVRPDCDYAEQSAFPRLSLYSLVLNGQTGRREA
jgi:hypothetical protein